jgi:hypothetical protein
LADRIIASGYLAGICLGLTGVVKRDDLPGVKNVSGRNQPNYPADSQYKEKLGELLAQFLAKFSSGFVRPAGNCNLSLLTP